MQPDMPLLIEATMKFKLSEGVSLKPLMNMSSDVSGYWHTAGRGGGAGSYRRRWFTVTGTSNRQNKTCELVEFPIHVTNKD